MIQYYIIPSNVHYVQNTNFLSWEKTDKLEYNVPTVLFFTDSITQHYKRFVVVYKGMMQSQGGSGSCYNPTRRTFSQNEDPMDNSKMPRHMSKWEVYDLRKIYQRIAHVKYDILTKMCDEPRLPIFVWDFELYLDNPALLCRLIDLVALKKAPVEALKVRKTHIRHIPKLLTQRI